MFLSRRVCLAAIYAFSIFAAAACSTRERAGATPTRFAADSERRGAFPTRPPDVFSTDIIIKSGTSVRRIFFARSGTRTRTDFDVGTPVETGLIRSGGEEFVISVPLKTFATMPAGQTDGISQLENDLANSLLNNRTFSKIDEIGVENGLRKFRVKADDGGNGETIVYVDDQLGLPVRQEFYAATEAAAGAAPARLAYSFELQSPRLQAADKLFAVPADYKKVAYAQFIKAADRAK